MSVAKTTNTTNTSVLQDWLVVLPIRMQSTLILGLRGPDAHACPNVKSIQRWLRGLAFKPGNPDNVREFMHDNPPRIFEKGPAAKELEFCTQHFYSHLMHALEVVAYKHPNPTTSRKAHDLFVSMCSLFHLAVECLSDFENRLCAREWPGGKQPGNFSEALEALDLYDR